MFYAIQSILFSPLLLIRFLTQPTRVVPLPETDMPRKYGKTTLRRHTQTGRDRRL